MVGTYTDFVLDNHYFHTGQAQYVQQNLNGFNTASQGAILLTNQLLYGHYNDVLAYNLPEDIWSRRDITTNAAIASGDRTKLTETNERGVKLNVKMFLEQTLDSFQKNMDPAMKGDYQEVSYRIGQWTAERLLKKQLNQAIMSLRAALAGQAASLHTVTVSSANYSGQLNSIDLNTGRSKLGDAGEQVVVYVMHSKSYYDLVGNQIADKVTDVSGALNLRQGTAATFGKPVLVIDSPGLTATIGSGSTAYTQYWTLGLVGRAAEVAVSELLRMDVGLRRGYENLIMEMQGESAHNLTVKGFQWDATNVSFNPTDANLATGTSWDAALTSVKQRAGFVIAHR